MKKSLPSLGLESESCSKNPLGKKGGKKDNLGMKMHKNPTPITTINEQTLPINPTKDVGDDKVDLRKEKISEVQDLKEKPPCQASREEILTKYKTPLVNEANPHYMTSKAKVSKPPYV